MAAFGNIDQIGSKWMIWHVNVYLFKSATKMKRKFPKRIVIYPEDVENLTGWSPRSVRRFFKKIRERAGKKNGDILTVTDFCNQTGLTEEQVRPFMSD